MNGTSELRFLGLLACAVGGYVLMEYLPASPLRRILEVIGLIAIAAAGFALWPRRKPKP